jgi:thymidylate synthase ThyX
MDLRGYRMTVAIHKHPEYRGIGDYFGTGTPRRYSKRTLDEWVEFAKGLAAEHGGVLPNAKWIQKNHRGLHHTMRKHPERFEGIPQARLQAKRKTLDEWVEFAKALAAEHGGVLPNVVWIQKNHPGLDSAMRRAPGRFDDIPQAKPYEDHRTLDEWVEFAKALAAEHGGVLPNVKWIQKNHRGLDSAMQRCPERFEGISQARLRAERKTPDEWVEFAKQLAAEHGGVLPNVFWIQKNHPGLASAIQRRPERFKGFKQEVRDSHGRLTGYRGDEEK